VNGTRLVSVKSLFARLTTNLSPFAFELPIQYLPLFVALLREIGMQESLTNSYAGEFLWDIKKACSYHRLNPNELHAVMEILKQNTSDGSDGCYDSVIADDAMPPPHELFLLLPPPSPALGCVAHPRCPRSESAAGEERPMVAPGQAGQAKKGEYLVLLKPACERCPGKPSNWDSSSAALFSYSAGRDWRRLCSCRLG
jgi:hypothetical protein